MKQFVPMTDEMLYQSGFFAIPIVPYQVGLHCLHSLNGRTEELAPMEDSRVPERRSIITCEN